MKGSSTKQEEEQAPSLFSAKRYIPASLSSFIWKQAPAPTVGPPTREATILAGGNTEDSSDDDGSTDGVDSGEERSSSNESPNGSASNNGNDDDDDQEQDKQSSNGSSDHYGRFLPSIDLPPAINFEKPWFIMVIHNKMVSVSPTLFLHIGMLLLHICTLMLSSSRFFNILRVLSLERA